MADINASIQLLSKTESFFITNNPVLKEGQPAWSKDIRKLKIGDGTSAWSDLSYVFYSPAQLDLLLEGKLNTSEFSDHEADPNPHGTTLEDVRSQDNELAGNINMATNRILNLPEPASQNEPFRKIDFDSYVSSTGRQRGEIDCSANPNYPASIQGDRWEVTAPGKIGGASGISVQTYDEIVCKTDSEGGDQATAGADFYVVQGNVERATESTSGYLALATISDAETQTDDEKAMTAFKVKKWWDYIKTIAITFAETLTLTKSPVISELTASKFVKTDADKKLASADIAINDISDATAPGKAILGVATPGESKYIRVNDDGSVTALTAAELKSALSIVDCMPFFGSQNGTTVAAGGTVYFNPNAETGSSTTEAARTCVVIVAGTIKGFWFMTQGAQPGTGSMVITMRHATGMGAFGDADLTVTISAGAAAGIFSDLTHTHPTAAGDRVTLRAVNNASSASAAIAGWGYIIEKS